MGNCGLVVVDIVSPKYEERQFYFEVSHMTGNNHYNCQTFFHGGW